MPTCSSGGRLTVVPWSRDREAGALSRGPRSHWKGFTGSASLRLACVRGELGNKRNPRLAWAAGTSQRHTPEGRGRRNPGQGVLPRELGPRSGIPLASVSPSVVQRLHPLSWACGED